MDIEELLTYDCPQTGRKRIAGVYENDDGETTKSHCCNSSHWILMWSLFRWYKYLHVHSKTNWTKEDQATLEPDWSSPSRLWSWAHGEYGYL